MKILKPISIFGIFIFLMGCVYTKNPVLDSYSREMDSSPKFLNGHFEIKILPDDELERFGTSMVEIQQITPTQIKVYAYESFTEKDLAENPHVQLNKNLLTFGGNYSDGLTEKEEFKVTPINGKFIYAKRLKYDFDLEKHQLTTYEGEKEEIKCFLKKYNSVVILNMFLNEGWGTILIEPIEDGTIIFKHVDYDNMIENIVEFSKRFGPIEIRDSVFIVINPPDSEIKNLLGDQNFFKTVVELKK